MPVLGNVKFNWDTSGREAEFTRWKKNAQKFKANKNSDKQSQAAFLWDWLGSTGERVRHKMIKGAGKENVDTIFDQ